MIAALCGVSTRGLANYLEDMGYNRLERFLPVGTMPDGSGIPAMQIEATEVAFDPDLGQDPQYSPVAGPAGATVPGSGVFSGKDLTLGAFDSTASGHGITVGRFFFGNNTDPNLGVASMAPGVTDILVLLAGANPPNAASNGFVRSNAWIGSFSTDATTAGFLRDYDREMNLTAVLHVSGLNNGSGTTIPKLAGPAYNGIAAGLSNGNHSRGTTPDLEPGLTDEGRIKPELVAPIDLTSWATGMISSAATLLWSAASGAAQDGLVIKAALLASASRDETEFPASARWSDLAVDKPLHPYLGAGEVDVYRGHAVITSPQQAPAAAPTAVCGWDIRNSSGSPAVYNITVPNGVALEFGACLTWNSVVTLLDVRQPLADMSLVLRELPSMNVIGESDSAVDNVELIVRRLLSEGDYQLEVSGPSGTEYAIAWLMDARVEATLSLSISGGDVEIAIANLAAGKEHRLERFGTAGRWETIATFTPVGTTAMHTDIGAAPLSGQQLLYRVIQDEL